MGRPAPPVRRRQRGLEGGDGHARRRQGRRRPRRPRRGLGRRAATARGRRAVPLHGHRRGRRPAPAVTHRPWDVAWHDALYGPAGFYRRPEGPAGHFRTAAHASGRLGAALARLARSSGCEAVVDVGTGPADRRWAACWWPTADPRARIEVGRTRDELWASLVHRVSDGLALAVDYGHTADRRPASGSLTGYRGGRQVAPVPDGSSDLTAHVALDALVEVAPHGLLLTQAEALGRLGIGADRPSVGAAAGDPMAYLAALSASSEAHELLDPGGLGAFGWVLHPRGDAASRLVTEWTHGAPS